jgi:hypothetical protein
LKEEGVLHADTPIEEFAGILKVLVSGGFLTLAG